jgi:polar amino acid transport system substrate-binding protein
MGDDEIVEIIIVAGGGGKIMNFICNFICCAFLASVLGWAAHARAEERVVLTTLDWPPYTGAELPRQGATTEVVQQAFAGAGIQVDVDFVPWKRAIAMAKNDPNVVAYFPGYHCHHDTGFVASQPIGRSPLGFAEHVDKPIQWSSLDEIKAQGLQIGTVLGYANTDAFDESAADGSINAIPAKDDATNLRKLALQRLDAAVIDKLVMSYLLATDESLKPSATLLRFDETPLDEKTLHVCFNDNPEGRALRERFDAALAEMDVESIVDKYFLIAF